FHFTSGAIFLSALMGLIGLVSFISFNEALRIGNTTLVGTISGSFVALVVLFSVLFLKESLTSVQLLLIIVTLIGIILTSLNLSALRQEKFKADRSIILALLTMVGWGVSFTFIKIPIHEIGWFWPGYIANIAGLALVLLFLRSR